MMITNHSFIVSWDHIHFNWVVPKYTPERYQLYYSCRKEYQKIDYANGKLEDTNSALNSFRIVGLHPRSRCKLTFFAMYNPASIDQGITLNATTRRLGTSLKLMLKILCVYNGPAHD